MVLENVKSVICSRSGILYPTNRYGVPDIEEGIHYDGIRDGFGMYPDYLRKNLSETDREIIDGVFDEMARRFSRSRGLYMFFPDSMTRKGSKIISKRLKESIKSKKEEKK